MLGAVQVSYFFVKSQDPKGKMKFERTPDIPVIAGDGITYGVWLVCSFKILQLQIIHKLACAQFPRNWVQKPITLLFGEKN